MGNQGKRERERGREGERLYQEPIIIGRGPWRSPRYFFFLFLFFFLLLLLLLVHCVSFDLKRIPFLVEETPLLFLFFLLLLRQT